MAILSHRLAAAGAGLLLLAGCAGLAPQTARAARRPARRLAGSASSSRRCRSSRRRSTSAGPPRWRPLLVSSGVEAPRPRRWCRRSTCPRARAACRWRCWRRRGATAWSPTSSRRASIDLMRELAAGTPVVVLQNLGVSDGWHYAVAVGYDYRHGHDDPALGDHRARGDDVRGARVGLEAQRLLGDGRGAARPHPGHRRRGALAARAGRRSSA